MALSQQRMLESSTLFKFEQPVSRGRSPMPWLSQRWEREPPCVIRTIRTKREEKLERKKYIQSQTLL